VVTFDVLHGAGLRSRLALLVQGRTEPRAQVAVTDGEELLGLVPLDVSGAAWWNGSELWVRRIDVAR